MLIALVALLGLAGTAYGKGRTTVLAGYVSAGSPVNGARLSVYAPSGRRLKLHEKRSGARSDAAGFFVLVLPGRPSLVRLVATGGRGKAQSVKGSLQAIVRHPGLAEDAFVNPATTVIAAYAGRHRRASLARATREGRHLLSLKPEDAIGRELLTVTPYFDGFKFLRAADAAGGVQPYVSHLIRRHKPVAFRGTRRDEGIHQGGSEKKGSQKRGSFYGSFLPGSFEEVAALLQTAGKAVSAVGGIAKFAYDVFKWAQGPEPTNTQIYKAIEGMQEKLGQIQNTLDTIKSNLNSGFDEMLRQIGQLAFNEQVRPLKNLAGTVAATEDDFQDVLNNATADHFSETLVKYKMDAINRNITDIERDFQQTNDLFRDAFLKSAVGVGTTPAYYYAGQTLLNSTEHFMTPNDSERLQQFATFALDYQALAFNLIVRWETYLSPEAPDRTLTNAIKAYLGFDSNSQAANWVDNDSPRNLLTAGDLRDELDYLDTVTPVPRDTIVEADGVDNAPGPMWQSKKAVDIKLGRTLGDAPTEDNSPRPGFGCSSLFEGAHFVTGVKAWANNPYSAIAKSLTDPAKFPWCQFMQVGWTVAQGDLTASETALPLDGWTPAGLAEGQALLTRLKGIAPDRFPNVIGADKVLDVKADYWDPDPQHTTLRISNYNLNANGGYCRVNEDPGCSYYFEWVDGLDVTTFKGLPKLPEGKAPSASDIASMGVKGSCWFGVGNKNRGSNCPVLHVMFRRQPAGAEHYWPLG